jgi:hypothetical protein
MGNLRQFWTINNDNSGAFRVPQQANLATLETFHNSINWGITFPHTGYALPADYLAERLKNEGVEMQFLTRFTDNTTLTFPKLYQCRIPLMHLSSRYKVFQV